MSVFHETMYILRIYVGYLKNRCKIYIKNEYICRLQNDATYKSTIYVVFMYMRRKKDDVKIHFCTRYLMSM